MLVKKSIESTTRKNMFSTKYIEDGKYEYDRVEGEKSLQLKQLEISLLTGETFSASPDDLKQLQLFKESLIITKLPSVSVKQTNGSLFNLTLADINYILSYAMIETTNILNA